VINEETTDEVSSWAANAQSLQEDIIRSKTLANDIIRQADAPDVSGKSIQEAEEKAAFLAREVQYSQQLHGVLKSIHAVHELLGEIETARNERRILDSLHLLESA
jgi:centromere/kinetochore protein ZW10